MANKDLTRWMFRRKVPLKGDPGNEGAQGDEGLSATISVGTVMTLTPGSSATVSNVGTPAVAVLNFGIPQGADGLTGPTGLVNVVSLSTPSRAFGVPFQPHATRPVLCSYSIQQTCTVTLGGDIETVVELRCDSVNPPLVVRERLKLRHSLGLGVGVGQTVEHIIPLRFVVPAGHWVNLVATVEAGSTAAINAQCEEVL